MEVKYKGSNSPEKRTNEQLVRELLAPGNLIWGGKFVTRDMFKNLCSKGILPALQHKARITSIRPYAICLSMLSNIRIEDNPMANYIIAIHKGAKESIDKFDTLPEIRQTAIVIEPSKLLKAFPNKVSAVGERFHKNPKQFPYDQEKKKVAGIPIGYVNSYTEDPWPDEVILKFEESDNESKGITPDFWKGIVVSRSEGSLLREWLTEEGIQDIPMISPEGEIL